MNIEIEIKKIEIKTIEELYSLDESNYADVEIVKITNVNFNGSFPNKILEFPNLKELTLNSKNLSTQNGINVIPELKFDKLKKLNLSGNNISNLENICNLTNLEELNLEKCDLNQLPQNIGNLSNLKILNLLYNKNLKYNIFTISKLTNVNSITVNVQTAPHCYSPDKKYSSMSQFINQFLLQRCLCLIDSQRELLKKYNYIDFLDKLSSLFKSNIFSILFTHNISFELLYIIYCQFNDDDNFSAYITEIINLYNINLLEEYHKFIDKCLKISNVYKKNSLSINL